MIRLGIFLMAILAPTLVWGEDYWVGVWGLEPDTCTMNVDINGHSLKHMYAEEPYLIFTEDGGCIARHGMWLGLDGIAVCGSTFTIKGNYTKMGDEFIITLDPESAEVDIHTLEVEPHVKEIFELGDLSGFKEFVRIQKYRDYMQGTGFLGGRMILQPSSNRNELIFRVFDDEGGSEIERLTRVGHFATPTDQIVQVYREKDILEMFRDIQQRHPEYFQKRVESDILE